MSRSLHGSDNPAGHYGGFDWRDGWAPMRERDDNRILRNPHRSESSEFYSPFLEWGGEM